MVAWMSMANLYVSIPAYFLDWCDCAHLLANFIVPVEAAKDVAVPVKFAIPGKERQDSVRSGLNVWTQTSLQCYECLHNLTINITFVS